jgi:hypothetical protein
MTYDYGIKYLSVLRQPLSHAGFARSIWSDQGNDRSTSDESAENSFTYSLQITPSKAQRLFPKSIQHQPPTDSSHNMLEVSNRAFVLERTPKAISHGISHDAQKILAHARQPFWMRQKPVVPFPGPLNVTTKGDL